MNRFPWDQYYQAFCESWEKGQTYGYIWATYQIRSGIGSCTICGEPLQVTFFGPVGVGGVCRDEANQQGYEGTESEGQHIFSQSLARARAR